MKKSIYTSLFGVEALHLELNEDGMYEVFNCDGTCLGAFDSYLFEDWDSDDAVFVEETISELVESGELYIPYWDGDYYAAA